MRSLKTTSSGVKWTQAAPAQPRAPSHHFDYISEYGISASCGASVLGSLSVAVGGQEASGDRKLNQQMQDLLSLMEVYVAVQT